MLPLTDPTKEFGILSYEGPTLDHSEFEVLDLQPGWASTYAEIRSDEPFDRLIVADLKHSTRGRYRADSVWTAEIAPYEIDKAKYWAESVMHAILRAFEPEDVSQIVGSFYWKNAEQLLRCIKKFPKEDRDDLLKHLARFTPDPDALDWFACVGRGSEIAPATCRLAMLAYPEGEWRVLAGKRHGCAVDVRDKRVVDLLWRRWSPHPLITTQDPLSLDPIYELADTYVLFKAMPKTIYLAAALGAASTLGLNPAHLPDRDDMLEFESEAEWIRLGYALARRMLSALDSSSTRAMVAELHAHFGRD